MNQQKETLSMIKTFLCIIGLTFSIIGFANLTENKSIRRVAYPNNPPEFIGLDPISMPEITEDDINNKGILITDLLKGKTTDKDPNFNHGILITESPFGWEVFVNGKWETPVTNLYYWIEPKDLETTPSSESIIKEGYTVYGADQRVRFRPDLKNGELSTLKFTLVDLLDLKQVDGKWKYSVPVDGILKECGTLGEINECTSNTKETLFMEGFEFYTSPKSINLTVKVKDVNDPPKASSSINSSYIMDFETKDLKLKGLYVSDVDENEIFIVTMKLENPEVGLLSSSNGAVFNNQTGTWSITGSASTVNYALNKINYTTTTKSREPQAIEITINDDSNEAKNEIHGTINITFSQISFSALENNKESKSILKTQLESVGILDIQPENMDHYQKLLLDSITTVHNDKELIQEVIDEVNAGRDIIFNRLYNGWNLISAPFEGWSPDKLTKQNKFLTLFCFGFNKQDYTYYKSALSKPFKVGDAYWLYVHIPQSQNIDFIDYKIKGNFTNKSLELKEGWNLIGPTQPRQGLNTDSVIVNWTWNSAGGGGYWVYGRGSMRKEGLPTFYKLGGGYWVFYLSKVD